MRKLLVGMTIAIVWVTSICAQVEEIANSAFKVKAKSHIAAYGFSLKDVRLLDGPFKHAMELNMRYLLELEPDRLLSGFRSKAGLEPRGRIYGGWEKAGVAGHSLGHYLSACSLMYAQSGDSRLLERVNYIVDELQACQNAQGDGYVAAIPRGREIFEEVSRGDIRTKGFDLNGCWVPLYTLHKQLAGLIDAYRLCGNTKAIKVAAKLADFLDGVLGKLNDEQMQKLLFCEHGGLNEVMANLYAITQNEKYLNLAKRIYHKQILDPLAQQRDQLSGRHSNTQVPKVIGIARLHELTGIERYRTIARFFWKTVIENHTYVNGGNSAWEYFGPPKKLSDRLGDTTETCNTYNMLKLTRHLFSWTADARYADYYERALYNHILAHQHPETGMMVYKGFLDRGAIKHYSTPFDSFWCCVGSGMENHSKYGDSIFFHDGRALFVNLFIASQLNWRQKEVTVRQETQYPQTDETVLKIGCRKPVSIPIHIRHPYWAIDGMKITVNGRKIKAASKPGSFARVTRKWRDGDEVRVKMPMKLRTESMPDNPNIIAFMYGPIVLCAEVSDKKIPVLVPPTKDITSHVKPAALAPLEFITEGLGKPDDIRLIPLYKMHDRRYNVYFDRFTPDKWAAEQRRHEAEQRRIRQMQARTVDMLRIGEMQPERDHNLKGEKTSAGTFKNQRWRHAIRGGWFSFEMEVLPDKPLELIVRYWGGDSDGHEFDILLDDVKIATQRLQNKKPGEFFFANYKIPKELSSGKTKVTVRFQAHPGKTAGGVFGCWIIKRESNMTDS